MKNPLITFVILTNSVFFFGCSNPDESATARRSWQCMGTIANLTLPAEAGEQADGFVDVCEKTTEELEGRLSTYRHGSELSAISRLAGKDGVRVSDDTLEVLQSAVQYAQLSKGAFDPTVGPMAEIWGFGCGDSPEQDPTAEEIQSVRHLVDYRKINIRSFKSKSGNHTNPAAVVSLEQKGMELDLGGIAKGYAVDRCYEELKALGTSDFIVGIGGNLRCEGARSEGKPWRIGVRNPFVAGTVLGRISLSSGMAVATSGNYERFVEIEGNKFAHIIDPRTGVPVQGMAQVTVIADTAVDADALSTILFVMGMKTGIVTLERAGGEALFATDSNPPCFFATPGFMNIFDPDPEIAEKITVINEK